MDGGSGLLTNGASASTKLKFSRRVCPGFRKRRHEARAAARTRISPGNHPDLETVLAAMTAEELRSFLREALEHLDDEPRCAFLGN